MINYRLLAVVAIAIINLVCYGNASNLCIFIGCACQRERIRCPLDPNPLTMFPKRRIVDGGTKEHLNYRNLTIDLSSNRLEMVPDDRFADLDVHFLDLSKNQIARISPDAFRDLIRLENLSLAQNRLRSLSATLFAPVKHSLEGLSLASNHLGEMETIRLSNVFLRLNNLEKLNLSSNRLFEVPNLSQLTQLTQLDLRDNQLESLVDSDTIEILLPSSLEELYVDDNQLKHISENWFENLGALRYLSLSNNQISAIAEKSFEKLTSLTSINLSRNMLKHIPSEIIYYLDSLEVLDLSSQVYPIQRIDDYAFSRESHKKPIKRILLNNNSISVISKRAFCVRSARSRLFANIKEIDLSQNRLASIDSCVLRQLARGYSEPIYTSKLRLYAKVVLNRDPDPPDLLDLIECTCEITRANKLLDLEGLCRRKDFTTVSLNQYDCGDYTIINANQVNKYCSGQIETECVPSPFYENWSNQELTSSTRLNTSPQTSTISEAFQTLPIIENPAGNESNEYSNNSTQMNQSAEVIINENSDQIDMILIDKGNQSNGSVISVTNRSSSSQLSSITASSLRFTGLFKKLFIFICIFYSFVLNI